MLENNATGRCPAPSSELFNKMNNKYQFDIYDTYKNTNPSNLIHCRNSIYNSEHKIDTILLSIRLLLKALCSVFDIACDYISFLAIFVILVLVLYVLYKSYWSPVVYVKELIDVGYNHLPKGPTRSAWILRAQNTRQLGQKLPPPYPNGWFAVAESRDLKVGDVTAVNVLGHNLCVYRGEDDITRCVDAYCPHLGANLAIGGAVYGNCIECPFHKWRFSGNSGACVSVPGQDTPPRGVGIRTWLTIEVDGAVWIWHDAEDRPPLWSIQDAEELDHWKFRGRNEYIVNSHIQDIPENGADVAHLNAVHSSSLFTDLGEKYPFLLNFVGRHTWSAEWNKGEDHRAEMRLSHDYKFGKIGIFHMKVIASQLGPGHVRLHFNTPLGPMLISQSVTPLSPLEQKVVHRIFSPAHNAPFAAAFVRGESYMFERDIVIWNSKRFVSQPTYVRADRTIRAFRSWYSQFYTENSISFKDALRKQQHPLDW